MLMSDPARTSISIDEISQPNSNIISCEKTTIKFRSLSADVTDFFSHRVIQSLVVLRFFQSFGFPPELLFSVQDRGNPIESDPEIKIIIEFYIVSFYNKQCNLK